MVRALIYDLALAPLTRSWYAAVLSRLPVGAHLLDVGIGTGAALAANAETIRHKRLTITGIDINEAYLERCRRRLATSGLAGHVRTLAEAVEEHLGGPYDAVYFSASFMLLAHPVAALAHVRELLAPGGRILFTQTFEKRRSSLVELVKPRLRALTTIEFGRVTYLGEFREMLDRSGLEVATERTLREGPRRFYALVEAVPRFDPPSDPSAARMADLGSAPAP